MYYYDEPSSVADPAYGWLSPASTAVSIASGQGYSGFFGNTSGGTTIDVTGTAQTGSVPISLTSTGSGWNLIGNP